VDLLHPIFPVSSTVLLPLSRGPRRCASANFEHRDYSYFGKAPYIHGRSLVEPYLSHPGTSLDSPGRPMTALGSRGPWRPGGQSGVRGRCLFPSHTAPKPTSSDANASSASIFLPRSSRCRPWLFPFLRDKLVLSARHSLTLSQVADC